MKLIRTRQALIVLASLLFVTLLSGDCLAQCTAQISGRVTIDGSAPDARVDVHLLGSRGSDRAIPTNNDGRYIFGKVCPGSYRVRPGPAWWENAQLPSPYTPSSQEVTIPAANKIPGGNEPVHVKGIDFMRTNPPGQGGGADAGNFIKDKIKIDESVRSGRDLKLAREIEQFLESTLPCKDHLCDLTIKVREGDTTISGIMGPFDRPLLNKVKKAIGGVKRLDISGVRSKEQP